MFANTQRPRSGTQLQFGEPQIRLVRYHPTGEDGELKTPIDLKVSDIGLAEEGADGWVSMNDGTAYRGHVEFLPASATGDVLSPEDSRPEPVTVFPVPFQAEDRVHRVGQKPAIIDITVEPHLPPTAVVERLMNQPRSMDLLEQAERSVFVDNATIGDNQPYTCEVLPGPNAADLKAQGTYKDTPTKVVRPHKGKSVPLTVLADRVRKQAVPIEQFAEQGWSTGARMSGNIEAHEYLPTKNWQPMKGDTARISAGDSWREVSVERIDEEKAMADIVWFEDSKIRRATVALTELTFQSRSGPPPLNEDGSTVATVNNTAYVPQGMPLKNLKAGIGALEREEPTPDIGQQMWEQIRAEEKVSVPQGFAPEVVKLVRERGSDYGTPAENHQLTADMWSAWLSRRLRTTIKLSGEDVCMLNVLQKQSRLAFRTKDDSWFDVAGYAENVAMLKPEQRNK